jgi:thioredoxin reductase (NADPH)
MGKPVILTVDDDLLVSAAITRDLSREYGADYRVISAQSGSQALSALTALALRDEQVALIVADQRMPQMTGIDMLAQASTHAPDAKFPVADRLRPTHADTDVAMTAINEIGLDYYLLKPWDPPEVRLYPVVDDLLGDWRQAHLDHTSDVKLVGHRWSDRSHELKMFLARNDVPYRWYDVERDAEGTRLRDLARATPDDLPLVLVPDGGTLRSPSTLDVAGALGLQTDAQQPLYDVCIVGAGPAGLAAGVYAASEGLSTGIVDRAAPGGQAGPSAAIENYLGFPKGLSGSDLAHRGLAQVSRFGVELVLA